MSIIDSSFIIKKLDKSFDNKNKEILFFLLNNNKQTNRF